MAMKDLNNVKPPANDEKWRDEVMWGDMPKHNTWYCFRLVGGVYSIRQHWIEFINKDGEKKRFSLECRNWNVDTETTDLENDCLPCTLNYKGQVRYLVNAIDRNVQVQMKAGVSPIRGLDLPPTLVREIQSLDKLNVHDSRPVSVAHPDLGCDIHLQLNDQSNMNKWLVQKGNCVALTPEEREYDLYAFDEIYRLPNPEKTRMDFERMGLIQRSNDSVANMASVTTVQVPTQLESTPAVAPSITAPNTVPTPTTTVAPPVIASPPVTVNTPTSVTVPSTPVVSQETTAPVQQSPVVNTSVVSPSVTPASQSQVNSVVASTPIAVNPPTASVATEPTANVENAEIITKPACFPDGSDPNKRYLGEMKCIRCPFKEPCISASGNN